MATYDPRPHELERDDSRQVDHHLIEGAAGYLRVGGHDVSKPSVNVVSWSAVRIGPMIIVAPQRGHVQVARVGTSVATAGVAADGRDLLRSVLASATRAARQVLARNPDWRIRTKRRGRMCWTKRRRNSRAESVIVRDCWPWA